MLRLAQLAQPLATLTVALTAALLGACQPPAQGSRPDQPYNGNGPIQIVATTAMIGDLAARIGGERVSVHNLMGPGVDPHLYQPNASDLAALQKADLILFNGLHLEGRMADVLHRLSSQRPVLGVAESLSQDPTLLLEAEGHHDPHVWMDPNLWARAADAIAHKLQAFDPAHAAAYAERNALLQNDLRGLDDYARQSFASIPADQRVLVSAHDAFGYLARRYQLQVRAIQGLSTESEAGLRDLEGLVNFLVEHRIPAVFVESSVPQKSVEALVEGARARSHQVRIGGELYSDAMGRSGSYEGTYLGMIDHNVTTITRALGGQAPAQGWQGKLSPSH